MMLRSMRRSRSVCKAKAGVSEVMVVAEERSAYVKIDSKVTNRFEVEQAIAG